MAGAKYNDAVPAFLRAHSAPTQVSCLIAQPAPLDPLATISPLAGPLFLLQASSRSWSGDVDLCMHKIGGRPILAWTLDKVVREFPNSRVVIVAPAFDSDGVLPELAESHDPDRVEFLFAHDDSPLDRMVEAASGEADSAHVIRLDGLHMWFHAPSVRRMLDLAAVEELDLVKFPDDFPVQFTSEVFGCGALRRARAVLSALDPADAQVHRIHPKHFMVNDDRFRTRYLDPLPGSGELRLEECREQAQEAFVNPRLDVTEDAIRAGDQLTFHYELAAEWIGHEDRVLDLASGIGYGGALVARHAGQVVCADVDEAIVREGAVRFAGVDNLEFCTEDATKLSFDDGAFDVYITMETIEHVPDDEAFLSEARRVVRPGGRLVLSTPQNSLGRIPVNPVHVREYSLVELLEKIRRYFAIRKVYGLKSGRIVVDNDPIGSNTVIVAERPG